MMSIGNDSSWRAGVRRVVLWTILVSALFALIGCPSPVEVYPRPAATPVALATVVPQPHNVAIVGVDFDPPFNYAKVAENGSVALMVAIENRGQDEELVVSVHARLLDPQDGLHELVYEAVDVKSLKPGEVRVVRFAPVSVLPLREKYRLDVEVRPVSGETVTSDNYLTYDIVSRQAN